METTEDFTVGCGEWAERINALADQGTHVTVAGTGQFSGLSDDAAAGCAQELERVSRLLDGLKVLAAGELAGCVLAGRFDATGAASPGDYLCQSLLIGGAEAARRLALARAVLPGADSITGQVFPAPQRELAGALFRGELSEESVLVISRHVQQAAHLYEGGRISAERVAAVEKELVEVGTEMDKDILCRCASRTLNHLDADGKEPTEGELLAKEGIRICRPRRGLVSFSGHMTALDYEEPITAVDTSTNPRSAVNQAAGRLAKKGAAAIVGAGTDAVTGPGGGDGLGGGGDGTGGGFVADGTERCSPAGWLVYEHEHGYEHGHRRRNEY